MDIKLILAKIFRGQHQFKVYFGLIHNLHRGLVNNPDYYGVVGKNVDQLYPVRSNNYTELANKPDKTCHFQFYWPIFPFRNIKYLAKI